MRCPAERGQDTDNQIKERRDTRHFAPFGEEELFGFMLSDVASIAREDSNVSEGGAGRRCALQVDVARLCRGITQPCTSIKRTFWTTEGAQVAPRRAQSEIAPEMERT